MDANSEMRWGRASMIFSKELCLGNKATASYQIEGAWRANGRGWSIWDDFARKPGKVRKVQNGDVACDHYNRFLEDVSMMKAMRVSAYRFSISWPRILPLGKGLINEPGIRFYHDLIDCLLEHRIEPWVTLYHWDLPLVLHCEENGWLNLEIADLFAVFADLCFDRFGDRVKEWITINEPWYCAMLGCGNGMMALGRVSDTEPYLAGHNITLAHAKAARLYQKKYQDVQKGEIGLTNNCDWREPHLDTVPDREAAQNSLESFLGWFADPIYFGEYPESLRDALGAKLPRLSASGNELLMGSASISWISKRKSEFRRNQPMVRASGAVRDDCGQGFTY